MRPTWDARFETLATVMRAYGRQSARLPIEWQRRAMAAPTRRPDAKAATSDMKIERVLAGGVAAEWLTPPGPTPTRSLLYLHGGGYSLGSIDTHRAFVARLCRLAQARALVVDYRLAPEHRFPAQLDDARAALRWMLDSGVDPTRLVIGGESAGGGLTMSTLLATRDAREALPAGAFVLSPWVDLEASSPSITRNARYDYIDRSALVACARNFVGSSDPRALRDPLASPIHADFRGLPPLLVQAGGAEAILDDAHGLAIRARAAGVDVTYDVEPDMIHAFQLLDAIVPCARGAIDRLVAFVKARTPDV